jgi:hypothetical protein
VVLLHWFCLQTQNRHLQQIPTLTKWHQCLHPRTGESR